MKRVMYISTLSYDIPTAEIEAIGKISSANNQKIGVTGVLLSAHEFFFQILEGETEQIDRLVERIRLDPRHRDVLILRAENDVSERLFPGWSMRTVRLGGESDMILQAIRIMLENITQSHRIIERYTQPTVLRFLTRGINPLDIPVQKSERVILFGDMVGFSFLSQKFPVDEVAEVVNAYLSVSSQNIADHGGEVTKYVGDCVMAHFPCEQADNAIAACLKTLRDLQAMRGQAHACRLMKFLYTGFGLSKGTVIEGNIGSPIKLDYTVLGNTVNLAARLESLTRGIGRAIAISSEVRRCARQDWPFEPVGAFKLKGQDGTCEVYSIDDPAVVDCQTHDELIRNMELFCAV
ncbi:MAG: BLUF domain-containing protein [Candidatus Methylumidiphilus sp.]